MSSSFQVEYLPRKTACRKGSEIDLLINGSNCKATVEALTRICAVDPEKSVANWGVQVVAYRTVFRIKPSGKAADLPISHLFSCPYEVEFYPDQGRLIGQLIP